MNATHIMKKLRRQWARIALFVALVAAGATFATLHYYPSVKAQSASAPVIGIQAAQGSGSGGCSARLSNIAYSDNPSDFAGSSSYGASNTDCAKIYLSGQGPFTQDFQIGVRMQNPKKPGGWGPWGWTGWASDIANSGGSWSPWIGDIMNAGSDPGHSMYQVTVNTRPLPSNETISGTTVGLQVGDGNTHSNAPYYCDQPPSAQGDQVFSTGGGSTGGKPYSSPNGFSGANDVADCTRIFLSVHLNAYGAQFISSNMPTSFNLNETKSIGTDGQPIEITMKNTGNVTWPSQQGSAVGTPQGTCDVDTNGDGIPDAPAQDASNAGKSCTVSYRYYSAVNLLSHVGGSFGVNPQPAQYSRIVPTTITYAYGAKHCYWVSNCGALNDHAPGFVSRAYAMAACGQHYVCDPPSGQYETSYGQSLDIAPGDTATFIIDSMTAPGTPGNYSESWQVTQSGVPIGDAPSFPITVNGPQNGGTITVTSQDINGNPINASWNVFGPVSLTGSDTGYKEYHNLPSGSYGLDGVQASDVSHYSLENVLQKDAIASTDNFSGKFFALAKDMLFKVAKAYDSYECMGNNAASCESPQFKGTNFGVLSGNPSDPNSQLNYIVVWNPVASMSVSPSSLSLNGANKSGSISIQNTGVPGSALDWSASVSAPWLSVSSNSGTVTNNVSQQGNNGATQGITVSVDDSQLIPGTYTGTVHVNGTSQTCPSSPYSCSFSGTVGITFTGGTKPTITSVTVTASPASIATTQSATCSVSVQGSGNYNSAVNWSASNGTISGSGSSVSLVPSGVGTATCTATSVQDGSKSGAASVSVVEPPSCSISVSPTTIVVPQSAKVSYDCQHVNTCTLGGGQLDGQTAPVSGTNANGTKTVTPTAKTSYSITCVGAGSTATASATTVANITNPGRTETNP